MSRARENADGARLDAPLASPAFTGTPTGITATHVGLPNVENTALSTWAGSTNITSIGATSATSLDAGSSCQSASYYTDTYVAKGQNNQTNDYQDVIQLSGLSPGIYHCYITVNGNFGAYGAGGIVLIDESTDWGSTKKYNLAAEHAGNTNIRISGTYVQYRHYVGTLQACMWSIKKLMQGTTTITT